MSFLNSDEQKIYSFVEGFELLAEENHNCNSDNMVIIDEILATPIEWLIDLGFEIKDGNSALFIDGSEEEDKNIYIVFKQDYSNYPAPEGFTWISGEVLASFDLEQEDWLERLQEVFTLMASLTSWIGSLSDPSGQMN